MATFSTIARGRMPARVHVTVAALLATAIAFSNADSARAQDPTTTKLTHSPKHPKLNATLIAEVRSPAGTPTGNVTFREGSRILGSESLSNGKARVRAKFKPGSRHVVTAFYGGGPPNFAPSQDSHTFRTKRPRTKTIHAGQEVGVSNNAGSPDAARLSDGGFVLVWQGGSGDGSGIYAQRHDADGAALGDVFSVARGASKTLTQPAVTDLGNGGFVVAWASSENASFAVEGQRFDGDNNKAGEAFLIGTGAAGQGRPALARLGKGFVAIWSSARDGSRATIAGQRYDAAARKLGSQFEVNVTKSRDQRQPAVAALDEGFVVAWLTAGQTGADIMARRYNAEGAAQGGETRVNSTPASLAANPQVASLGDDFVVAWAQGDGNGLGIHAQHLGPEGKIGGGIKVNATVAKDQSQPAIAGFEDGTFAIAWTSQDQDGSGKGVYSRLFDEEGRAAGAELLVNNATSGDQWQPRAVAVSDTRLVAFWTSVDRGTSRIAGRSFDLLEPAGQTASAE